MNSNPSSPPPAPTHAGEQGYKAAINNSLVLQSLLYDLDLLPEQLDCPSHDWDRMLLIVAHFDLLSTQLADLRQKLGESEAKASWVDKWAIRIQIELEKNVKTSNWKADCADELRAILQKGKQV